MWKESQNFKQCLGPTLCLFVLEIFFIERSWQRKKGKCWSRNWLSSRDSRSEWHMKSPISVAPWFVRVCEVLVELLLCVSSYLFTFSFPSSTGLRHGGWEATRGMSVMVATLSPDMTTYQNPAAAGKRVHPLEYFLMLQNSWMNWIHFGLLVQHLHMWSVFIQPREV